MSKTGGRNPPIDKGEKLLAGEELELFAHASVCCVRFRTFAGGIAATFIDRAGALLRLRLHSRRHSQIDDDA